MSGCGWRAYIAIGGLALALALPVQAQPVSDDERAAASPTEADTEPANSSEPVDLAPIKDALQGITSALEAIGADPNAKREQERAETDLQAQQSMAKWAKYMFWAAFAGTILTAIATVLIWLTLRATKRTLDEAKETTRAAIRSVEVAEQAIVSNEKAARKALVAARKATIRQLRAYVYVDEIRRTSPHQQRPEMEFAISIRNAGQTPAHDATVRTRIEFLPSEPVEPAGPLERQPGRFPLGPGAHFIYRLKMSVLTYDQWMALVNGTHRIYIHGTIQYETVSGGVGKAGFRFVYGLDNFESGLLSFCQNGNQMY